MSLIKCSKIAISYESNIIAENLSFQINSGDYLIIAGENGSGKSSLIKTLLGLKAPSSGTIEFGDGLKRNEIGYLPQQNSAQKGFPASVREIVISGCQNKCGLRPFYSKPEKMKTENAMESLGISNLSDKCYRELSGGQQQRVLLARALCSTEKLILLDEPVAGLDPFATLEFYKLIKRINTDGITVVMVSHDIKCASEYATSVLHLRHSDYFFGSTKAYLSSELGEHFASAPNTLKGEASNA